MRLLTLVAGKAIRIGDDPSNPEQVHIFEPEDVAAIQAAEGARRPLLLRGEPGVGKSQFARAAAAALGWGFVHRVVDARTEARDLLWEEDPVARLADAQLVGALGNSEAAAEKRRTLDLDYYIKPGPLWWAFNWDYASDQAKKASASAPPQLPLCDPAKGMVALIDEIDKAEPDVPNGLLEAIGAREFTPPGPAARPVQAQGWPLVVITTNEERVLPAAFLRRCVVHEIVLPRDPEDLKTKLITRGRAHFPDTSRAVLAEAAQLVADDRQEAQRQRLVPLPGQAEYLDVLRAVVGEGGSNTRAQKKRLGQLSRYFLKKHLGQNR